MNSKKVFFIMVFAACLIPMLWTPWKIRFEGGRSGSNAGKLTSEAYYKRHPFFSRGAITQGEMKWILFGEDYYRANEGQATLKIDFGSLFVEYFIILGSASLVYFCFLRGSAPLVASQMEGE